MRLPWVSRKAYQARQRRFAVAFASVMEQHETTLHDLRIAETALEAERQWRLTSLPALLAAEERAVKAEARVAELEVAVTRELTTQFPELRQTRGNRALINAYHESKERP